MNFSEALDLVYSGKKVQHPNAPDYCLYRDDFGHVTWLSTRLNYILPSIETSLIGSDQWELVEEVISGREAVMALADGKRIKKASGSLSWDASELLVQTVLDINSWVVVG